MVSLAIQGELQAIASVVSSSDEIDAAFCSALRTTLVGSMTPAFTGGPHTA
jgi:hypothetical protein